MKTCICKPNSIAYLIIKGVPCISSPSQDVVTIHLQLFSIQEKSVLQARLESAQIPLSSRTCKEFYEVVMICLILPGRLLFYHNDEASKYW